MKKSFLRFLFSVIMIFGMTVVLSVSAKAYEGDGTGDNPYVVTSFSQGDVINTPATNSIAFDIGDLVNRYYVKFLKEDRTLITSFDKGESWTFWMDSDVYENMKKYSKYEVFHYDRDSVDDLYVYFKGIPNPTSDGNLLKANHVHNFTWQTIYEATSDSDGLEGEICSCGATRNTQPISAMDYAINKYADQMIKAAKPGQKITLKFGEFNSFPRYMMEKVAARMNENITFVFKFKQNKKMQTVTIEPGTAIDLQYDWYGPDKMKELYGAE